METVNWQQRADQLQAWLKEKKPIVIYGAGTLGQDSFHALNKIYDLNVTCFLDMDPEKIGTKIEGIEIKDPTDFNDKQACIIVASVFTEEICPWLKQQSFENTYLHLAAYLTQPYYRYSLSQIEQNLADDVSYQTFTGLMNYYFGLKTKPPYSDYPQYIHPNISYDPDSHIIDGGAYIGDSAALFKSYYGNDCYIYAFEPDSEKYDKLKEYAADMGNITPINAGLWHEEGQLSFQNSDGYAGKILLDKRSDQQKISVTPIDDLNKKARIDFIKMDIEGAELSALKGAEKTIKIDEPNLAISIYHKPEDWVILPALIMDYSENHDFYIGHHSQNFFETVFYAIRRGKS